MQLKPITAIIVLSLVVASLLVAGCATTQMPRPLSKPLNNLSSDVATNTSTAVSATPVPTSVPTLTPTPVPTPVPTQVPVQKLATSIYAWVPPVWYGWGLIPNPGQSAVKQGDPATVAAIVNAADGVHPCGPFNYYIDHQAAGGAWQNPQGTQYGCGAGIMPHAELLLSSADTAKLSVGIHMFQISYAGDAKYAPAEFVTEFQVVKA